jgi:hypothetical protein
MFGFNAALMGAQFQREAPASRGKKILLRKAQVWILFEARNLRLDCCELTLKLADLPALAQQLLLLAFHDAPHIHSDAITLPWANAWHYAGGKSAPNLAYFSREYADSIVVRLSGTQQNGKYFLISVNLLPCVERLER